MLKKISHYVLLVVLALAVGTVAGLAYSYRTAYHNVAAHRLNSAQAAHLKTIGPALADLGMMEVDAMRDHADTDELRRELLRQVEVLSDLKQQRELAELAPIVTTHLGFVYLRLARIAEGAHRADSAREFMTKAQREFQSAGWRDCSEASLKNALDNRLRALADSRRTQGYSQGNENLL